MNWKSLFLALNFLTFSVFAHVDLDITFQFDDDPAWHSVLSLSADDFVVLEVSDNFFISVHLLSKDQNDITCELLVQEDGKILSRPTFAMEQGSEAQLSITDNDTDKEIMLTLEYLHDGQRSPDNPLRRQLLYAPFREHYDKSVKQSFKKDAHVQQKKRCVFCADIQAHEDQKRLILTQFKHNVVFLNLFPYARGHILIIPKAHVADMEALSLEARQELMEIIAAVPRIFQEVFDAGGTNIGINVGKIAGASKPDHLHIHALPRSGGDHKAYIQLVCETEVVQWDLNKLYQKLKPAFDELKQELGVDILEYYESGQHEQEMRDVLEVAWQELEKVSVTEHSTIVLDIDETVLSNYEYYKKNNWKKDSEEGMAAWKALGQRPAFAPVLEFYNKVIKQGFKVIFISSSGNDLQEAIANNLINEGYTIFEQIILRTPEEQKQGFSGKGFSSFKTKRRQQLVDQGYEIVACVGDQWSDLEGGNTGLKIKVPTCFS